MPSPAPAEKPWGSGSVSSNVWPAADSRHARPRPAPPLWRRTTGRASSATTAGRLADATIIPYDFNAYARALRTALGVTRWKTSRLHVRTDMSAVQNAIARFSGASFVYGALPALDSSKRDEQALAAAHALDGVLYGANTDTEAIFPAINAALERHSAID